MAAVSNNLIMVNCEVNEESLRIAIPALASQPASIPLAKKIVEAVGSYPCSASMFAFLTEYAPKVNASIPKERVTADFQLCNLGNISPIFQALTRPAAIPANMEPERKAAAATNEPESKVAAAETIHLNPSESKFFNQFKTYRIGKGTSSKDAEHHALFLLGKIRTGFTIFGEDADAPLRASWNLQECRDKFEKYQIYLYRVMLPVENDLFTKEAFTIISQCPEVMKQMELTHDCCLKHLGFVYDTNTHAFKLDIRHKNNYKISDDGGRFVRTILSNLILIGQKDKAAAILRTLYLNALPRQQGIVKSLNSELKLI